jgi:mannose-6-phosphate isomerase
MTAPTNSARWISRVRRVDKPWGHEELFALVPDKFCGKVLHIDSDSALSLQYHKHKEEVVAVQSGHVLLQVGTHESSLESLVLSPGDAVHLVPGMLHRFRADYGPAILLEASTTHLSDVVRIDDLYGRQ